MSMSNYGCSADTITEEFVRSICPNELRNLLTDINIGGLCFDEFCEFTSQGLEVNTDEKNIERINESFNQLCKEFNKKTGLILEVSYCDAEEKSDELEGGSFSVDGVYGLTEAGKKYIKDITHKEWTTFG